MKEELKRKRELEQIDVDQRLKDDSKRKREQELKEQEDKERTLHIDT